MTPKQVYNAAIPAAGYIEGNYYPVPGVRYLEAKVTEGRGSNIGKMYITLRKPATYKGSQLPGHYDTARARYPDGEWKWV